jgi:hypothetical protein
VGPLSRRYTRPRVADGGNDLQIWRAAAVVANSRQGVVLKLGGGELTTPTCKKHFVLKCYTGHWVWIILTENKDQWRILLNRVLNLWVPKNVGKFLSS